MPDQVSSDVYSPTLWRSNMRHPPRLLSAFVSSVTTSLKFSFHRGPVRVQPSRLALRPCRTSNPRARFASTATPSTYNADDITVLEGLEPVRLRPGMYIGSTGSRGLHHLVYEVVDNAVDEALAGYCKSIVVVLHQDGSVSIRDDGRGIPVEKHPTTGKSALETVMTVLHAGGKFGGGGYKVSGGLHGVGVSVVNALSEWLTVTVWRGGEMYEMEFRRGVAATGLRKELGKKGEKGTMVRFKPDNKIFLTTVEFDEAILAQRLEELAFLNAGLEIVLEEEVGGIVKTFRHEGGVAEYVDALSVGKSALYEKEGTIYFHGEKEATNVEVALRWNAGSYTDKLMGFANNIRTGDGGTHLEGLRTALTRTINQLARKAGKLKDTTSNLGGEFIREGLTAIVSVKVSNPEFEGQTKSRLGNPEVRSIVDGITSRGLIDFFEFHPNALNAIVEKALSAFAAAEAARRAREVVRKKTVLESSTLPGKLADCSSRDPAESEIFLVEGESAGGSAKQARDRMFQAILPLRGKILNIEKTDDAKIYQNAEIGALITALGLGIRGEEFNQDQLRYFRIIIMTDADVDGAHIRTLLLTFFFRYQRRLIEDGYVYIACPPLYKVDHDKKHNYVFSDAELNTFVKNRLPPNAKYRLQRFKGLGEMMPAQLWATTMDPNQRQLKKVEIEDAILADQVFTVLMGDRVAPRRDFIEAHAASLSLDEIDF